MSVAIHALFVGKAKPLPRDGHADVLSGMVKAPQTGWVWQVSQGRLLRREGAALAMQTSGATGWYYRVLQEGLSRRRSSLNRV